MNKASVINKQRYEVLIHICVWLMVLGFPLLIINGELFVPYNTFHYLRNYLALVAFAIVFYVNYILFFNRFFLKKRYKLFFSYNFLLVLLLSLSLHIGIEWTFLQDSKISTEQEISFCEENNSLPQLPPQKLLPPPPPHDKVLGRHWLLLFQKIFLLTTAVALASAIRIRNEWRKSEQARQQAEFIATENELKNLRNQVNPHFLLNTLNNIYALISFNTEKAQEALIELSKLLRYLLYENQNRYVPISQEIDFIKNYTELMRIRLSDHIDVQINIMVEEKEEVLIAPLIFVSLIENAFKHGISATLPSFIHIYITTNIEGDVECLIKNSNFPKNSADDKSGNGIGLEQVYRQLELLYPNAYEWKNGLDSNNEIYTSHLIIHTRKQTYGQLILQQKNNSKICHLIVL